MNTKTTVGLIALILALVGAFFGGRTSVRCPQSLVPPESVKGPEVKPLKPDTVWRDSIITVYHDTGRIVTVKETLKVASQTGFLSATFPGRWPHTGDSAAFNPADSTLTLTPFGFVPQEQPIEAGGASSGLPWGRKQPLLEIGAIWSWGGSDQFFATIPNPVRDGRLFYTPQRVGVSYQPYQHRWGLSVSWTVF